jgi:hypothetical protein
MKSGLIKEAEMEAKRTNKAKKVGISAFLRFLPPPFFVSPFTPIKEAD